MKRAKSILPVDIHVGERIRALRLAAKPSMSQEQLARHLGLTFQQVQKYEKGANRISSGKLAVIAKLFNVEIGSLFPPTNGASPPEDNPCHQLGQTLNGVRLARAYNRVSDLELRGHIVGMVERIVAQIETQKPSPRRKGARE